MRVKKLKSITWVLSPALRGVFVFKFQHFWRSTAQTVDVQWSHRRYGPCVFLHLTLTFLQDCSVALRDLGRRDMVMTVKPVNFWFANDLQAICVILTLLCYLQMPGSSHSTWNMLMWTWSPKRCVKIKHSMEIASLKTWSVLGALTGLLMPARWEYCEHSRRSFSKSPECERNSMWLKNVLLFRCSKFRLLRFYLTVPILPSCCILSGWLWWSVGVWHVRPGVSVWRGELGWRLCQEEQTRCLHEGHQLQQVDRSRNKAPHVHTRNNVPY